jgi:hypothetical protein
MAAIAQKRRAAEQVYGIIGGFDSEVVMVIAAAVTGADA